MLQFGEFYLRSPSIISSTISEHLEPPPPLQSPQPSPNVRRSSSSSRRSPPRLLPRRSSSARTASSPLIRRIHQGLRGSGHYGSEKSLRHFLTKEVLPHADHYRNRMSFQHGQPDSSRPTLDELLHSSRSSSIRPPGISILDASNLPTPPSSPTLPTTAKEPPAKQVRFGWIEGVYVPCLLNIWGVMLFLRLTWVIGQAGLLEGLGVITVCNLVTGITSISMSAVCTNGRIRAGGIYFMISRSLGPEFGGAVGITFTLASAIAVSMYIIGFCESLMDMLYQYVPGFTGIIDSTNRVNDIRLIGSITLVVILGVSIVGMNLVSRVQMGLLVLLIIAQVDFIVGTFLSPTAEEKAQGFVGYNLDALKSNLWSDYRAEKGGKKMEFFSVLAVFFPAVTGIVAGANLSGDLKDPATAIPKGTLWAILTTFLSYIVYGCSMASTAVRFASGDIDEVGEGATNETVKAFACADRSCQYGMSVNQQMMQVMSAWGPLIFAGCFAATLSSAIGSLVGGPRVLQAVAKDKLFPGISCFSKGWGGNNDPIRGYLLVFAIALVCIIIGDLNQVSSLLSNFFVSTYAIINYAVFHASINKSPGWRPSFRYFNKWISLLGSVLCIAVMVLMDYKTSLVTLICIILLYVFVRTRSPNVNWGSSSQSQSFITALKSVQTLAKVEDHVKNYRPKLIVMAGNPSDRPPLIDFANLITKRISLLELVHIVNDGVDLNTMNKMKSHTEKWLNHNHIKAFYALTRNASFCEGVRSSIELSGLGKLSPNMMLIGFQEHWWMYPTHAEEYFKTLQTAFDLHLAVGVLRVNGGLDISEISGAHEKVMVAAQLSEMSDNSAFSAAPSTATGAGEEDDGSLDGASGRRTNSVPDFKLFDAFRKKSSRTNSDISFGIRDGNPIDERIIYRLTQFRDKTPKEGVIDVYWLYDDGGLPLLLPHILTTRTKFAKCKLRVFFLSRRNKAAEDEAKSMAALLDKFRIEFQDVILLSDATKKPSRQTKDEFKKMISVPLKPAPLRSRPSTSSMDSVASMDYQNHNFYHRNDAPFVSESDMAANLDKTNFHLRIAEIAKENSKEASLVVMTLPLPKRGLPHTLYLAWLDFTTRNMPPFLFVRGNQESVLTFYS